MTKADEVIEHEGVKYWKVEREAEVGDKVVVVDALEEFGNGAFVNYGNGDVLNVTNAPSHRAGVYISSDQYLCRREYAVLEPIEPAPAPAMPKLTDAKPGDTVRITFVQGTEYSGCSVGSVLEVTEVWNDRSGVNAINANGQHYALLVEEFEVVREESESLEEAAQLAEGIDADNVKKPAHYTQGGVEVIEYIEQVTAGYSDGFVAHCVGTAIKYVSRAPHKHATPTEDLRKAREYLNFAIARLEAAE